MAGSSTSSSMFSRFHCYPSISEPESESTAVRSPYYEISSSSEVRWAQETTDNWERRAAVVSDRRCWQTHTQRHGLAITSHKAVVAGSKVNALGAQAREVEDVLLQPLLALEPSLHKMMYPLVKRHAVLHVLERFRPLARRKLRHAKEHPRLELIREARVCVLVCNGKVVIKAGEEVTECFAGRRSEAEEIQTGPEHHGLLVVWDMRNQFLRNELKATHVKQVANNVRKVSAPLKDLGTIPRLKFLHQ